MTTQQLPVTHAPDARQSIDLEFDRVLGIITGGTSRYQGLSPEEIAALIAILEEKRAEFKLRGQAPGYTSRYSGRVQTLLISDPRAKAVFDARLDRRRAAPDGPVRYMGFRTTSAARIFSFGRLPARAAADLFEVCIPHQFFSPQGLALQEGPAFCATLLAERNHPQSCDATQTDVQDHIARKPQKTTKR